MAQQPDTQLPGGVLGILREVENLKHSPVPSPGLDPQLALLRSWQSQRLAQTYADLLATSRYRPACAFFMNELYAARDFSQRDHDIEQMYGFMSRVFPAAMIRPLKQTVDLHRLTQSLDSRLLEVLVNQLGLTDSLTESMYAEAYRLCDNYVERVKQIEWIYKIGLMLDEIMGQPLTGTALAIAKVPARRAGWTELTDFLDNGYKAFKHMHGAEHFVNTIRQREKQILDKIYAEDPTPFAL